MNSSIIRSEVGDFQGVDCQVMPSWSTAIQFEQSISNWYISALQQAMVQTEPLGTTCLEMELGVSQLQQSALLDVSFEVKDYKPLLPGDRIVRMGRHEWYAWVIAVEADRVLVRRHQDEVWLERVEVYPFDASGKPHLLGTREKLQAIAQRARTALKQDEQSVSSNHTKVLRQWQQEQIPFED